MKSIAGLCFLGALVVASSVRAELVSKDLWSSGDGLLTLDTSNNLEWLDLTPTLGYTSLQASEALSAGPFQGFRLATESDFEHLVGSAGLQLTGSSPSSDPLQIAQTLNLQSFLGSVVKPIIGGPMMPPFGTGHYSLGYLQAASSDAWGYGRAIVYEFNWGVTTSDVSDYDIPVNIVDPTIGYFFVRDAAVAVAVPEPSTMALFGVLALGVACFFRNRRRA